MSLLGSYLDPTSARLHSAPAQVDSLGLLDKTYFFYTSDHGFQLGELNILMVRDPGSECCEPVRPESSVQSGVCGVRGPRWLLGWCGEVRGATGDV